MGLFRTSRTSGTSRTSRLSFEQRSKLPGIDDFDMKIQSGWYRVSIDEPRDAAVAEVIDEIQRDTGALGDSAAAVLRSELGNVWDDFTAIGDPLATIGARVPPGQAHVTCTSFFRYNGANGPDWPQASPENYEKELAKPDSAPGVHVDTIGSWRDDFPHGTGVSAYFLMHYDRDGRRWTEERVSAGYFPNGSSQLIEFAYTTPAVGANGENLPMLVREMMQSITVTLDG